jgi:MoxR-like ATPase
MRAMETGKIARIEELTRIPPDVQDSLITLLSEKALPIPELNQEIQARKGFNVIATSNDRDRGSHALSSALQRRFNTVVMPLPATLAEEVQIVETRVASMGAQLELPVEKPAREEIQRLVTIFRELREGQTEDGRTKLKSPSATLSTAEAIAVITQGLSLAAHFGDGELGPTQLAGGLTGAIIRDPERDQLAWQEYLETVMRNRPGWEDLYHACRE